MNNQTSSVYPLEQTLTILDEFKALEELKSQSLLTIPNPFNNKRGQLLYLDLNHDELHGWEPKKSDKIIESLIKGIEAGNHFPPVPVHYEHGIYYISPMWRTLGWHSDGGHHRAIAHYITNTLLKCELLPDMPFYPTSKTIPISKLLIVTDTGEFQSHKNRGSFYLD